jgi:hypothetical protein
MRRRLSLVILWIIVLNASGQEKLGMVNSNYAGVTGIQINPSSMVSSKLYQDINILSLDVFAQNNYLYIHKEDYRFLDFFRKDAILPSYGEKGILFDHYWNYHQKEVDQYLRIDGPSVMLVSGNHAFAFHTSFREILSIWRLPYHIANFIYSDLWYEPQHDTMFSDRNFSTTQLTWGEAGLSYATVISKHLKNRWTVGLSINRLFGYDGLYAYSHSLDYEVTEWLEDTTYHLDADIRNFDGEVGYSLPMDYNNNDFLGTENLVSGKGFSTSLGITYLRMNNLAGPKRYRKLCEQAYRDYDYRIGVSLIDLGWITFNENAQEHRFNDVSTYWQYIDEVEFEDLNSFMHELSSRFYQGDSTASRVDDRIRIYLPTALSGQLDYHIRDEWYLNGTVLIPVIFSPCQIYRPSHLTLTARYESRNLEVALPVSLYHFSRFQVGFSVRIWNLTIGTDNVLGFTHLVNFTGLNGYVALKINFNKGNCFSLSRHPGCSGFDF